MNFSCRLDMSIMTPGHLASSKGIDKAFSMCFSGFGAVMVSFTFLRCSHTPAEG